MASAEGVQDLLGLLAYAELVAFFRLSEDAALAPSLSDKAALGGMPADPGAVRRSIVDGWQTGASTKIAFAWSVFVRSAFCHAT